MSQTADQILKDAAYSHQGALSRFARAQQVIANATQPGQISPDAIEKLINEQAVVQEWADVVATITQDEVDVETALRTHIARLQNKINNWEPSNSTSDVYRVADKARARAIREIHREIGYWV